MPSGRIKGITIEIGGDTTKLTESLKDVDKELSKTNGALKDVNKQLKLDPGNTVLLEQKQRLLGDAIQKTKERLDKLKEAQAKAKELLEKGELGQDKYDALTREVEATKISLNDLEKQADETSDASEDMGNAAEDAGKDMESMGTESLTTMEALDKVGGVLDKISGKLIQLGQDAVAAWGDFDDSLDTIQYATGRSNEEMQNLEDTLYEINRTIPVDDINDLGAAIGTWQPEQILRMTRLMALPLMWLSCRRCPENLRQVSPMMQLPLPRHTASATEKRWMSCIGQARVSV